MAAPLGQHWLIDQASLKLMVAAAEIKPGQTVLEIGPGKGALTEHLLETQAQVFAVEFDESLRPELEAKYKDKVKFFWQDIRTFDWRIMPTPYRVCANIPYYLTARLWRLILDSEPKPTGGSLLLPEAVCQNLVSPKRSLLATLISFHYSLCLKELVTANCFRPIPKIDSQILQLTAKKTDLGNLKWSELTTLLRQGFVSPRKQLQVNLRHIYPNTHQVLKSAGIAENSRPSQLTNEEWIKLAQYIF